MLFLNEMLIITILILDIGVYKRDTVVSTNETSYNAPDMSNRFSNGDSSRPHYDDHKTVKKDLSKNGIDQSHTSSTNGYVDTSNVELSSNTSKNSVVRKPATQTQTFPSPTDTGRTPSYMSHTVCSLEHSRRNSTDLVDGHRPRKTSLQHQDQEQSEESQGNRSSPQRQSSVRRVSCSADTVFEDIFDLCELEQMLEIVVGYEQRRRIRAQIRLVKRQNTSNEQDKSKSLPSVKTSRNETINKSNQVKSFVPTQAKPSVTSIRKEDVAVHVKSTVPTPSKMSSSSIRKEEATVAQKQAAFIENPQLDPAIVRKLDISRLQQQRSFEEVKPVWATQNILKKASDTPPPGRKVITTVKKVTTSHRTQPKSVEEVDCVTSSYGIGPTDDYGKPLFGISALKRKTTTTQQQQSKGNLTKRS